MKQRYSTGAWKQVCTFSLVFFILFNLGGYAQVTLGTSPYVQDFNSIGSGLPTGWTVRTGASATALGSSATYTATATSWATVTGQFNNAASANAPSGSGDAAGTQAGRTDRALAVRQSGSFGDPGAAFVLQISNTTGLTAFTLNFKMMELDPTATAGRTVTWNVDYGFGTTPATFTNATTVPAAVTTVLGNGWGTTNVSVNFGNALDNNAGPVWIRVASKTASTGSGSRPVSAIDDFSLAWTATNPSLIAGSLAAFGNVCVNATAGPNSFSLTGANLNGGAVTVGPLSGYSFCETVAGTYLPSVSPAYTAPNLSATIYVKFTPTAVQSYSGNITVSGGGASTTVAASGAGVDNPPSLTTGAASSILFNGATLAGTITSFGCSALLNYGIEYSTTNGFPNGTGTAVPASNLAGNNFSSAVTGLSANTVYYYHAYATNNSGAGYGAQQSFTTAQLNAPVATAGTSVTNNSFVANWNSSPGATGYKLDVATTSTFYLPALTTVVAWNFPNNPDDNVADAGIGPNLSRQITAVGATGPISYIPVASSTTSVATGAGWDNGNGVDYWEVSFATVGHYSIQVSSAQRSSNTGPRDFKLQYKIGASGTYADVTGGAVTVANDWTTGVLNSISLPVTCENKPLVFLRWIMTSNTAVNLSAIGSTGTSGIDNVTVTGHAGSFVTGYNNLTVAGVSQLVNSNLTALTTYYYRVRATGGLSTSDNSNVITVTTTCIAPQISACPADIQQCDDYVANWTDPTATGDPAATVVCSPLSGSTFSAGITTVTCTASNGCGSPSTCSFTVTIDESPVIGTCPSDITDCNPVVTYSNPTASGTSPLVDCVPASGSTFAAGTTVVTCTASNACGSSSCTFNVNINTTSADPSSASSNANYGEICLGGNVTLSVNGGTLGTGASWFWYEGGCASGTSIGNGSSITVTPATSGTHIYFVRAEGACGNSLCASVSVNVINAPPSGTVHYTSALTNGCVAAPAAALTVNAVAGASFYRWTSAQAGVRFNGNPGPYETTVPTVNVSFVSLPAAGTSGWSICVFGGNACGNSNTVCTWIRAIVGKPAAINGSATGCPGTLGQPYSSAAEAGASSYIWSSTGGIVINNNGSQSITVDFPAGFATGTLSVHAQTSCGYNGPDRTITISKAPSIPGIITGSSYPCPNASSTYSIAAVPGAANYTWSTSVPGALVTGTSTSCSILFPAVIPAGSTVSVTANSSCPFSSPVRSKGISTGIPNVPQAISGPGAGQCGQTGVSYSISPVALATGYSWSTSCGTIVGPNNLSAVTVDWPASFTVCTLSVSANNSCGSGGTRILGVFAAPGIPGTISGNAAPCANTAETYSTSGSSGATSYNWNVPAGAVILGPANGSSILVQWGSASGNITVTASNSCGNSGVRSLPCTISCRTSQMNAVGNAVSLYPNPASEKTTLEIISGADEAVNVTISDATGRLAKAMTLNIHEGINRFEIDLSELSKGIYLVKTDAASHSETVRLNIQ